MHTIFLLWPYFTSRHIWKSIGWFSVSTLVSLSQILTTFYIIILLFRLSTNDHSNNIAQQYETSSYYIRFYLCWFVWSNPYFFSLGNQCFFFNKFFCFQIFIHGSWKVITRIKRNSNCSAAQIKPQMLVPFVTGSIPDRPGIPCWARQSCIQTRSVFFFTNLKKNLFSVSCKSKEEVMDPLQCLVCHLPLLWKTIKDKVISLIVSQKNAAVLNACSVKNLIPSLERARLTIQGSLFQSVFYTKKTLFEPSQKFAWKRPK